MMNNMGLFSSSFVSKKKLSNEAKQEEERISSETPRKFQEQKNLLNKSTRSIHEENYESSSHGYVHSAISSELQHFGSDSFMKGEK